MVIGVVQDGDTALGTSLVDHITDANKRPAPFLTGWTWTTPARPAPALVTPLYDVIICLSAVYFIPLIRAGFQSKGLTLESQGFNVSHCTCVSVEQSTASCASHPLGEKDLKHVRAHKNP